MADVITRFKLETNQFDSKLRDASQEMAKLSQHLQMAGNDFDRFAQKHVEAARALGQTESGATNLKDKLRDLVSAYNNVAKAYNNLTAEQQKGDFGKAMAASLDQLQGRITQTKNEMYGMTDSTRKAESGMGALNSIFGASITQLAGWGAAISAAKGALNVAKDAFFASEANLDEWGRTVESSQTLYDAFLTSINTGDISGFLSRMNQISSAAREAYDAMDLLGTQKTIQSPQLSAKQAEIARLRAMLQAGRYIAPADGRSTGGMKTGDILTPEQIKNISKNLEQALNEVANITKSQVKSATSAIGKLYKEQASILGISKQRFMEATSSWEKFQEAIRNGNEYQKFEREHTQTVVQNTVHGPVTTTVRDSAVNPFKEWAWVNTFRDSGEGFNRLVEEIQKRDAASSQLYGQYGQAYRRINRAEGVNPYGGGGHTNTTAATNEAAAITDALDGLPKLAEELKQLQQAQSQALTPAEWQRLQEEIDTTQLKISAFKGEWKENMQATFSVSVNDTEAYEKLKNLPNALIEEDVITVVADTAEAFRKCQDLFNTIEGYNVEFSIIPGQSELTFQNLNAIISDLKSKINTSGIGTTLYNTLTSRLADATAIGNLIRVAIQNGIDTSQLNLDSLWTEIINGEDITDAQLQTIVDKINSYLTLHHIELNFDVGSVSDEINESDEEGDGKSDEKGSGKKKKGKNINVDENGNEYGIIGVGKAASGFSSLISSVEQLGIELPEGLKNIFGGIQAVANILTSIMTIVQAIQIIQNSTSFLPFFANGGVVPHAAGGAYIQGNHYSGDMTPVWANAGEVILTRSQQGNLVSQLQNAEGGNGGGYAQPFVSGEQIYIGLSNYLRRSGRGELMTARR